MKMNILKIESIMQEDSNWINGTSLIKDRVLTGTWTEEEGLKARELLLLSCIYKNKEAMDIMALDAYETLRNN